MKFASNGKSVVCGQWTSKMKTHFLVSIAHCSDKDKFNKAEGKQLAKARFNANCYIVMPAKENIWGDIMGLKQQLNLFLELNC